MTQDELNSELDHFLEEGIFNGDLEGATVAQIRNYICAMVQEVDKITVSEEQWQFYAAHCLQATLEKQPERKRLIQ